MVKAPRLITLSTTVVRLVSCIRLTHDDLVSPLPINHTAVPLVVSPHPPLLFTRRLTMSVLGTLPRFVPAQTERYITKGRCL